MSRQRDLKSCREQIDRIDRELIRLLEERMDVARDVIRYKERKGIPVLDEAREKEKIEALSGLCREEMLPYISPVLREIMDRSKDFQREHPLRYGLLGKVLGHSHSPRVHRLLGDYEYGLFEREEEDLGDFLRSGHFYGLSVTIPYKRAVMEYCRELSGRAKACRSVNTIVRRPDGSLYGNNTDYAGFAFTVDRSGISMDGLKAVVLGSGGVSGTVVRVLRDKGARQVVVISRSGEDNYGNLERHRDAEVVVNATPVGMFPNAGAAPVSLEAFPSCRAVFDLIYNPLRTRLMLQAEERGIPAFGGLPMLVAQAAEACRIFREAAEERARSDGFPVSGDEIRFPSEGEAASRRTEEVIRAMEHELSALVLIGMPGSGKTTVGRRLAETLGRPFIDLDEEIGRICGKSPSKIISQEGESRFRVVETELLRRIAREGYEANRRAEGTSEGPGAEESGAEGTSPALPPVIACGGGIVERQENRDLIRENGKVIWIRRDLSELAVEDRPVSAEMGVEELYQRRRDRYESWSDIQADNRDVEETVRLLSEA